MSSSTRGRALPSRQPAKPIISQREYVAYVSEFADELGLTHLQVLVIASLMFDEQTPPYKHIVAGIAHPQLILS